ncbi:MAG: ABC transporter permease subunit [Desulfobulbaceae bacterium]|nr:MAG: ABC transporter permease subunit [Desulfobulbaceae bacterium]
MKPSSRITIITLLGFWLTIFGGLPLLLLLVTSFLGQHPEKFFELNFSLESYRQLLDSSYLDILLRSIKQAVITTLLCLVISYPFVWLTARMNKRNRNIVLILVMIPFWTNSLIRTYAVRIIIGTNGLLNKMLLGLGLIDSPLRLMYSETAVVIGLIYLMLPFMILPLYANLEKFDYRLVEAARDLGAGNTQIFLRIALPLTLPGIIGGSIMVFVPTMGLFYVASLLGGGKNLLVGNLIHQNFLVSQNWPLGAAMSTALILMLLSMLLAYTFILRKMKSREVAG